MAETATLQQIPLDRIDIHKLNPRRDLGDIGELVESIKAQGVIEPIVVVPANGRFLAVVGRRRLAAAKKAGLKEIPALVRELSDVEAAAAALVENLQRQDLSPLDEAQAYHDLIALTGWSQRELGEKLGRAQPTIANALRLLEATKPVKDALISGAITPAHARVALSVPAEVATSLPLKKGVTVEELQEAAREVTRQHAAITKLKADIAQAQEAAKSKPGQVVTWSAVDLWIADRVVKPSEILGRPPKAIVGKITGSVQLPGYRYAEGSADVHDKACDCRAVAPVRGEAYRADPVMRRVCVSEAGWKKYVAALSKAKYGSAGGASPTKQTAAARAKAKAAAQKKADAAAARALAVHLGRRKYSANARATAGLSIDPKFLKGGIDGEPVRLALFFISEKRSYMWEPRARAALWRRIAKLPLKKARELAVQHTAAAALGEIDTRKDERAELEELIYGHYGVEITPVKKKAKKKR